MKRAFSILYNGDGSKLVVVFDTIEAINLTPTSNTRKQIDLYANSKHIILYAKNDEADAFFNAFLFYLDGGKS